MLEAIEAGEGGWLDWGGEVLGSRHDKRSIKYQAHHLHHILNRVSILESRVKMHYVTLHRTK